MYLNDNLQGIRKITVCHSQVLRRIRRDLVQTMRSQVERERVYLGSGFLFWVEDGGSMVSWVHSLLVNLKKETERD